jgi:hypothetical protein
MGPMIIDGVLSSQVPRGPTPTSTVMPTNGPWWVDVALEFLDQQMGRKLLGQHGFCFGTT